MSTNTLHTGDALQSWTSDSLQQLRQNPDLATIQSDTSLKLQPVPLALSDEATILCDVSTGEFCPYVPESFRRTILIHFIPFPIHVSGQLNA